MDKLYRKMLSLYQLNNTENFLQKIYLKLCEYIMKLKQQPLLKRGVYGMNWASNFATRKMLTKIYMSMVQVHMCLLKINLFEADKCVGFSSIRYYVC